MNRNRPIWKRLLGRLRHSLPRSRPETSAASASSSAPQKELQEHLRELESVVLFANDAVLITAADPIDPPGPRIVYVNQAFSKMTGYAPEEVIGLSPRVLQGEETSSAAKNKMRQALIRREPVRVELVNYRKDRSPFLVEISIAPVFDETGELIRFISVQRETTELRKTSTHLQEETRARLEAEQSRKQLAAIFDNSMDAVLLTDAFGAIVLANRAALSLFGHRKEELRSMNITDLAMPDDPNTEGALLELTQTGQFRGELTFCCKDGSRFPGEVSAALFCDETNQQYSSFFLRDISQRRAAETEREQFIEALEETKRELRASAQARKEVLGIVAHDLRSPLTAALLQTEVLLETSKNGHAEILPIIRSLQNQLRRMDRLIRDLLDVANMNQGALAVHCEPLLVQKNLEQVLETVQPMAAEKHIKLRLSVADRSLTVQGDPHRLSQALENLISNAIKFTPPEGIIRIQVRHRQGEVIYSVSDTGEGIPPDQVPMLFQRFWQARKADHRGKGLGLAIVKDIIEAHGGRIWAESKLGEGTTIHFSIPLFDANSSPRPL